MGGLVLVRDEHVAWTGGKPKHDWSGFDGSASPSNTNPNQLRPSGVSSQQKSYRARTASLEEKLKPGDAIKPFADRLWTKLQDFGLDTITYVPDPQDPTKMVSVLEDYPRISLDHAQKALKVLLPKWDAYDRENNRASYTLLQDSLEAELGVTVNNLLPSEKSCTPEDLTFIVLWMIVTGEFEVLTDSHYRTIKERLRARKATD